MSCSVVCSSPSAAESPPQSAHDDCKSDAVQHDLIAPQNLAANHANSNAAGSLVGLAHTAETESALPSSSADSAEQSEVPGRAQQAEQPLSSTDGNMESPARADQQAAGLLDSDATPAPRMSQENHAAQLPESERTEAQAGPSAGNSAEICAADQHQHNAQSGNVRQAELQENAPASTPAMPAVPEGPHRSTAATTVGLWGRSKQKVSHMAAELAVATMVVPVVVSGLAVLHVPASMWAGACLSRAACKKVLGF